MLLTLGCDMDRCGVLGISSWRKVYLVSVAVKWACGKEFNGSVFKAKQGASGPDAAWSS